jgi:hypothetical protein
MDTAYNKLFVGMQNVKFTIHDCNNKIKNIYVMSLAERGTGHYLR